MESMSIVDWSDIVNMYTNSKKSPGKKVHQEIIQKMNSILCLRDKESSKSWGEHNNPQLIDFFNLIATQLGWYNSFFLPNDNIKTILNLWPFDPVLQSVNIETITLEWGLFPEDLYDTYPEIFDNEIIYAPLVNYVDFFIGKRNFRSKKELFWKGLFS